jgi:hypothetical protein
VSATGYAAANRAFLEDESSTTLHFPYTSPSAVPGEVTIELGIRGPYVNLMGGGPATLQALWWAARWLAEGRADRLLAAGGPAGDSGPVRPSPPAAGPLVEGAACLLLRRAGSGLRLASALGGPALLAEHRRDGARSRAERRPAGPGLERIDRGGRESAETRILAARGLRPRCPGLGEALALGAAARGLARPSAGRRPPWLTATWRSEHAALLWAR